MLGCLALGASAVRLLSAGGEPQEYLAALRAQMELARQILTSLGYGERHIELIEAVDTGIFEQAVWKIPRTRPIPAAAFNLSNEKRTTLEFIFEHLHAHAPRPQEIVPLAGGSPYGQILVDRNTCTLCLACVGSCPEGALLEIGRAHV